MKGVFISKNMPNRRKKLTKTTLKTTTKVKKKITAIKRKSPKKKTLKTKKSVINVKKVNEPELLNISKEWNKERIVEDNLDSVTLENDFLDDDRDKRLMMWAGVIFFMVLISSFWIMNMKNIFKTDDIKSNSESAYDWTEIKDELDEVMGDVKEGLDEINNQNHLNTSIESETPEVLSESGSKEEIVDLKNRLEEIERKMEGE